MNFLGVEKKFRAGNSKLEFRVGGAPKDGHLRKFCWANFSQIFFYLTELEDILINGEKYRKHTILSNPGDN